MLQRSGSMLARQNIQWFPPQHEKVNESIVRESLRHELFAFNQAKTSAKHGGGMRIKDDSSTFHLRSFPDSNKVDAKSDLRGVQDLKISYDAESSLIWGLCNIRCQCIRFTYLILIPVFSWPRHWQLSYLQTTPGQTETKEAYIKHPKCPGSIVGVLTCILFIFLFVG